MKKISLVFLLTTVITFSANAQLSGMLDKAKSTASAAGFDVNKLTSSIMGKLSPSLNLTGAQQPKVNDAVSSYLGQKANILPLQQSDPAQYQKKQSGLFDGLKTKLGGVLAKDQMSKFLGMKTSDPTNVLSQLFH